MRSKVFIILGIICALGLSSLPGILSAQNEESEHGKNRILIPGILLQSGFSHSGLNLSLGVSLSYKHFQLFAGPKISLSKSYLPWKGPWGIFATGIYTFNPEQRLQHSAQVNYEWLLFKQKGQRGDYLHELTAGYGLRYLVAAGFYIGNQLGLGFHFNDNYLEPIQKRTRSSGYNAMFRLMIGYEFN